MKNGSLINTLSGGPAKVEPTIGMGATVIYWTDREAATITGITYYKTGAKAGEVKAIEVSVDKATRLDDHGMSDAQSYKFEPDPDGRKMVFGRKKDGTFGDSSRRLAVGYRDKYYDYSF